MTILQNFKAILLDIQNLQFGNDADKERILLRAERLIRDLPRNVELYLRKLRTIYFSSNIIRDVWSNNSDYYDELDRVAWEKGKKSLSVLFEEILRELEESEGVIQKETLRAKEQSSGGDVDKILAQVVSKFSLDIKKPMVEDLFNNLKEQLKSDNPNEDLCRQNANMILKYGTDKPGSFDELWPFLEPYLKKK